MVWIDSARQVELRGFLEGRLTLTTSIPHPLSQHDTAGTLSLPPPKLPLHPPPQGVCTPPFRSRRRTVCGEIHTSREHTQQTHTHAELLQPPTPVT